MSDYIDIALGFDANFAPHGAAAIASAVWRTPNAPLRFTIFHDGVKEAQQRRVESVAPGMTFRWVEIGDADVPPMAARGHFTRASLFRLALERYAPDDCHRVIYLDSDVIVCRDLRELWRTNLRGAPIGAVVDTYTSAEEFAIAQNLPPPKLGYFNAGVLLIDLEKVRAEKLFSSTIELLSRRLGEFPFIDQDALNVSCWERWTPLDLSWNVQRHMTLPRWEAELPPTMRLNGAKPGIIHFTSAEKPWLRRAYHPWAWVYWESLARTPFFAEVAAREGMDALQRARLRLRWLRRGLWRAREGGSTRQ